MTTYEVRVTTTHVDYYHIEAIKSRWSKSFNSSKIIEGDSFIPAKKVDTIERTPEVDYGLELDNKGEVTYG